MSQATDACGLAVEITAELIEHLCWGDELREAGFHRQAMCYELFLDGRIPYDVMVRHLERQRLAGFADKLKSLPGKLKDIVQQQTAKWQQGISSAIKGSAQELAALEGIGDEEAAKTKKTLIQKSVEAVAKRVMSDYEESLAAIKDDPKAVEEFVDKLAQGAVKSMASTVGGAAAAFLFAGPAAVGVFLFRKALFNAAKSAIKAGDAKLERVLGEGYTEKKQQVKDVAKEKITSILRKVFRSVGKAGQGIGLGVGAMAILLKSGLSTKDALKRADEYLEKKIGKTGAAAVTGVLKGLIVGGVIRGGTGMIGAVAEWFSDEEVAGMIVAPAATEVAEVAEAGAAEAEAAEAAAAEMSTQIREAADAVKTDMIDSFDLLEPSHETSETLVAGEPLIDTPEGPPPEGAAGDEDNPWAKRERQDRAIVRLTKERAMELGLSERQYDEAVENISELDAARAEGVSEHVKSSMEREQKIGDLNRLADEINEYDEDDPKGLKKLKEQYADLREDIVNWEENRPEIYAAPGMIPG